MSEILQELELIKGEITRFTVPVKIDGTAPESGIEGWTFTFRLFAARGDADEAALIELTSAAGDITIFNADAGVARLVIRDTVTADLANRRYFFRLTAVQPNADPDVIARGWITITR